MMAVFNSMKKILIGGMLLAIGFAIILIVSIESSLPSVESLKDIQLQVPLKIYSAEGKLIAEYGEKRRTPIKLEQVPQDLINAIIAIEDRRFYQHPGVDLRGILRATVHLIAKGTKEQGGSTITMQVARNFFLTRKKTYLRKISEILLALRIEQELSKAEILELYLNKIYLGKRAYGVAAAAEVYYGTTIDKLTLAQMAMIAGLPQAPSAINPINSSTAALKRRNLVLEKMLAYNFITNDQYQEAINASITTSYHSHRIEVVAPYIAEMVRQEVIDKLGEDVYTNGYEVITTIDGKTQAAANAALARGLLEYDQRHGFRQPKKMPSFNKRMNQEAQLASWAEQLKAVAKVGQLLPAVICKVEADKILAVLATRNIIEIPFSNMSWAKPVSSGKIPSSPMDIVSVGDIIYTQQSADNAWRLAQVPEVGGAIVAMHPNNGAILALSGGFDYEYSSFNRATQAERQPGSSFKPFVYSAALANNFTAASVINDAPIVQADPVGDSYWRPQNSTKKFYGPTRLRVGITQSRNLVSIRLLKALGIKKTIAYLENLGFNKDKLPHGLSLALGTAQITPLEFTARYCTFPNGGFKIEPYLISKILDAQGKIIFQHTQKIAGDEHAEDANSLLAPRVLSPQISYLITSMLQDTIKHGGGRRALELGRNDLAGKTGTASDYFDAWYAGYNRDLVAVTWMGFDEPRSLKEYAVRAALPMWMYFMEQALAGKPEHSPEQPPGLVSARIDPATGLLAKHGQSNAIYELFTEDTVPKQHAPETDVVLDNISGGGATTMESLF